MDARTFETARSLYDEIAELERTITEIKLGDPDSDHKERVLKYLNDALVIKRKQFSDL